MTSLPLARLLGTTTPDTFFGEIWGRAPHLFPGSVADEAPGILDLAALERLLATAYGAADGWLHLADGDKHAVPPHMLDDDGMLDLAQLRTALAAGESLYLTKAERLSGSLMALCRAVELDLVAAGLALRRSVNAHVFLTPSHSRAFVAHRDEHASFVIQLDGTKQWHLYDMPPLRHTPGPVDVADIASCTSTVFCLEPGDILYMPEWWAHEAWTSAGHSLHVTLRVFPLRWSDVVRDIADAEPQLVDALPVGLADDPARLVDMLRELLARPEVRARAPALVSAAISRHQVPRVVMPDDGLRQALASGRLEDDTLLERCEGVSCDVAVDGDEVALRFPGGTLRGPAALQSVFQAVVDTAPLRPADLPDVPAGPYDRLVVAQRLVESGVLRVASPAAERDVRPAGRSGRE